MVTNKIKNKVTKSINIDAPIDKVWDALTNPKIIKLYLFGTDVTTDWKEGSPIFFRGNWHGKPYEDKGKVIKMEPKKLLRYSYWSSALGLPDLPENYTITTYDLNEENNKTLLSATQDNLASQPQQVRDYADEYWENLLKTLKQLLEK